MLGTSVSRFSEARALHDGSSIPRRPNAGLLLEDVKQEAADYSDIDGLNGLKLFGSAKMTSLDGGSGRRAARTTVGAEIVRKSLSYPLKLIAENSDVNDCVVIEKVLAIDNSRYGYDAATGKYEDLMAAGIIDPTKVMDSDLQEELCFPVPSAACYIKGRTTITFSEINLLLAAVASQSHSE
ncbi:Nuclear pore complex protein [Hordeum vulgare]|nr:Nuclear pore complex protein [Hordeum vulgare]